MAGSIDIKASYSYYINPEFINFGIGPGVPEYDDNKQKKIILELSSFADFIRTFACAFIFIMGRKRKK